MRELRPSTYTRRVTLANGAAGYQKLWECTSAPAGVQGWAVLEISYSQVLRQCVPTLRRLFTRKTGVLREIYTDAVEWRKLAMPAGGPEDMESMRRCASATIAALPLLLTDGDTELAATARQLFPPEDVLVPPTIQRETIENALENDRCGICGSVDHFREDHS